MVLVGMVECSMLRGECVNVMKHVSRAGGLTFILPRSAYSNSSTLSYASLASPSPSYYRSRARLGFSSVATAPSGLL